MKKLFENWRSYIVEQINSPEAQKKALEKFVQDYPETKEYLGQDSIGVERGKASERLYKKTIQRFKSPEEQNIMKLFGKLSRDRAREPVINLDGPVKRDVYRFRFQDEEGTKKTTQIVRHSLTKKYFLPDKTLEKLKSKHGEKAGGIYKYLADSIENIIKQPVPGSTKNPNGDLSKRIYLFSYLRIQISDARKNM